MAADPELVYRNTIEIILRAVITCNEGLLVCYDTKKPIGYLPGGHLEFNETIDEGLSREIMEEIGEVIKYSKFLKVIENFYDDERGRHHEINLLYAVTLNTPAISQIHSHESHFKVEWVPIEKLNSTRLLPEAVFEFLNDYLIKKI